MPEPGARRRLEEPHGLLLTSAVWDSLQNEAKEDFDQAIGWCVSLITDYRVRLGTWACMPSGRGTVWGVPCLGPGQSYP